MPQLYMRHWGPSFFKAQINQVATSWTAEPVVHSVRRRFVRPLVIAHEYDRDCQLG